MKFILGTKIGMTRVFNEKRQNVPVTLIQAGPMMVTQVRTAERDGYSAVQVGFGERKKKNLSRAVRGHLQGIGNLRWLREFRTDARAAHSAEEEGRTRGDRLDVSVFEPGDVVMVSGISKGKGFAGVVKRHGFKGGPRSHGQKHSEREPGSIATGRVQTVRKGKRMAGRMGGERVTVKGLKVVEIDKEHNVIAVSGAIPGKKGTLVEVRG